MLKNETLNDVIPCLARTEYFTGTQKCTGYIAFFNIQKGPSWFRGPVLHIPLYPKHLQFDDVREMCATENAQIEVQDRGITLVTG